MQTKDTTTQLLQDFGQLVARSVQTNVKLAQNSAELFRAVTSRKLDLPRALKQAGQGLTQAWTEYTRTGLQQAVQWLDLELALSNQLMARFTGQPVPGQSPPGPTVVDLNLKESAGKTAETAFLVENNRAQPMSANLIVSELITPGTGQKLKSIPEVEPRSLSLKPGEKDRVVVRLRLDKEAQAGIYVGTIWLAGCPEIQCRVVVEVLPPEKPAAPASPAPSTAQPGRARPSAAQPPVAKAKKKKKRK